MQQAHDALANGQIEGFYSATMLTIEEIMQRDRAEVFADTRTVMQPETSQITKNADHPDVTREKVGGGDLETITMEMRVEQPTRKPPQLARLKAAKPANATSGIRRSFYGDSGDMNDKRNIL